MQLEAFEQRESLTARLRNILHDYPLGIGIFFELLQNADDAKASEVALLLDERSHGATGLLSDLRMPAV